MIVLTGTMVCNSKVKRCVEESQRMYRSGYKNDYEKEVDSKIKVKEDKNYQNKPK